MHWRYIRYAAGQINHKYSHLLFYIIIRQDTRRDVHILNNLYGSGRLKIRIKVKVGMVRKQNICISFQ